MEVPLNEENAKAIWDSLKKELPTFALFQSDCPSQDQDSEVQDPMKLAVKEAIREVNDQLEKIKQTVRKRVESVAQGTLDKLREVAPDEARGLSTRFIADPKWEGFKLSLVDEDHILTQESAILATIT
jgi:putative ATP-dependent endonuclease of OLD family